MNSDSVNLGSNPSSPATQNVDISGKTAPGHSGHPGQTAHIGRTEVGTATPGMWKSCAIHRMSGGQGDLVIHHEEPPAHYGIHAIFMDDQGRRCTVIVGQAFITRGREGEAPINADLFAAAPDLLKAARAGLGCVQALIKHTEAHVAPDDPALIAVRKDRENILAAIAKATGATP
jgi:hypothetical protein